MRGVYPFLRLGYTVNESNQAERRTVDKDVLEGCVLPASPNQTLTDEELDANMLAESAKFAGRLKPL